MENGNLNSRLNNMEDKILAIIPARKNSKRLPGKNTKLLNNKPMICYTIEEALKSKHIDKIVINSDDEEIRKIANQYNIEFIKRPEELSGDDIPIEFIIDHTLKEIKDTYSIKVLLHITCPLRDVSYIDKCISMLLLDNLDSVVSVHELAPYIYRPNSGVYVFRDKIWNNNMALLIMPKEKSIDIDTQFDFTVAEILLKHAKN